MSDLIFYRKKKKNSEHKVDIWGREPLELYEKIGRTLERSEQRLSFTSDGTLILDLMVLFHHEKPDIRGVGSLLYAGEWINYSSKLYRVNTTLSANELEELIMEELKLTKADFLISSTFLDPRII